MRVRTSAVGARWMLTPETPGPWNSVASIRTWAAAAAEGLAWLHRADHPRRDAPISGRLRSRQRLHGARRRHGPDLKRRRLQELLLVSHAEASAAGFLPELFCGLPQVQRPARCLGSMASLESLAADRRLHGRRGRIQGLSPTGGAVPGSWCCTGGGRGVVAVRRGALSHPFSPSSSNVLSKPSTTGRLRRRRDSHRGTRPGRL